ncbi:hypothetical protein [Flavobacterium foetidum]|uniref:hypothetical protein n=1 Tax=Flavobacterium foetidum TaxID=2026681 RepID=UPI00107589D4|nr:hypothetical protein [Flavobacterium foetidum]KAF2517977.1 hypothetical protein E0W73_01830 [Flavobacterium foetidum]
MLKKITIFYFFSLLVTTVNAQETAENNGASSKTSEENTSLFLAKDVPEGVYKTYEDLVAKKGVYMGDAIMRKSVMRYKPIDKAAVVDQVYFAWTRNDVKLDFFAISYNGVLYIQQKYFHKYSVKEDRSQDGSNPLSYHRVINDGKFLYLEGVFANSFTKGAAYGTGGIVGGLLSVNMNKLKGVVFDIEKKEVNFIRDCEDLNLLIEQYNGTKIECIEKDVDIQTVRENIDKIIK